MILSHRHKMWELVPEWLKGMRVFRILYAFAVITDALYDMLLAAVKIRFPNLYSPESLSLLAVERGKFRGPSESPESFAGRLNAWWDTAKHSGDLFTIAKEMACYFLPVAAPIVIVTNNGTRYTLGTDGSWVIDLVSWDWDGDASKWSRFWVLLSNDYLGITGTDELVTNESRAVLDYRRLVGSDYSDAPVTLRAIEEANRAPHMHCAGILVILDETGFWASPPAGNWNHSENRNFNALYWAGTQ